MNLRRTRFLALLLAPTVVLMIVPRTLWAATGAAPGAVTAPMIVATVLSLLLGFVTQGVQSGSILGIATVPKAWLPELTLFATFLGGVVAFVASAGSAFALNSASIYGAVVAGVTALLAGAVPGLAMHAHVVVPAQIRAARMALSKKE